jgi:hypothetical protein
MIYDSLPTKKCCDSKAVRGTIQNPKNKRNKTKNDHTTHMVTSPALTHGFKNETHSCTSKNEVNLWSLKNPRKKNAVA